MEFFKKTSRPKDKLSSDTNVDINKASRILIFILIRILEVLCTISGTRHPSLMPSSTVYFSDSVFSYIKKRTVTKIFNPKIFFYEIECICISKELTTVSHLTYLRVY